MIHLLDPTGLCCKFYDLLATATRVDSPLSIIHFEYFRATCTPHDLVFTYTVTRTRDVSDRKSQHVLTRHLANLRCLRSGGEIFQSGQKQGLANNTLTLT